MVEVDEMHSCIASKKTIVGYGLLLIDMEKGSSTSLLAYWRQEQRNRKSLWENIKANKMKYIASDYWKPYESIIPPEKHLQTKAETFTVEGYNSLLRHFLAGMRRKENQNAMKIEMLKLSILMLMHHRNGILHILS